ncbi:MAG: cupin domain-containing protein [Candidatus Desulfatibia sp.]|uniref:cupin domain-containing protein n=1 Tax=Candidatus Desulfatibia sp. TaxID=3101189 RepID=UPI002F321192
MKIIHFHKAESYEPEKDWKRVSLCNEKDISMEHFVKPPQHASPRHAHPNAQVLVVLKGKLAIQTDKDGEQVLAEGDAAYIPGDEPHVVKNVLDVPSIGIDIFVPGRSFDFWLKRQQS